LELPAASIVIQIFDNCAVRQSVSTRHLVVHVAVHVAVFMDLCRWAVRAIVVVICLERHRAGLQGQIQPDGHKQAQGATAPRLLALSDAEQLTQVLDSTTIFAVSRNRCT